MQKKLVKLDFVCNENWDKMTITGCGRFCSTCKKEVIDFTKKGEEEITQILSKETTSYSCGNFYIHQVQTNSSHWTNKLTLAYPNLISSPRKNKVALYCLTLLFMLTGCMKRQVRGKINTERTHAKSKITQRTKY